MSNDDVVVIIPALNVADTLGRQLAALDAQTDLDFRVVIADNGSTDATRRVAETWSPRFESVEVVDASRRRGVATARNVGVESSDEELILICDGDDRVHETWVASCREGLADAEGVTGPLCIIRNGEPAETWNAADIPVSMGFRPYLPGCNLAVRRTAVDHVGGFDPDLVLGQEDVDFGWRMVGTGARLAHVPGASIDYYQRSTPRLFLRQQFRYGRAYAALYDKHRDVAPPAASWRASARWFWEWTKQYRPGDGLRALGGPAHQTGRIVEAARRHIRTPL